jgi:hypothetical protein
MRREINIRAEISFSHGDKYEDGCLLGCCTVYITLMMEEVSSSETLVTSTRLHGVTFSKAAIFKQKGQFSPKLMLAALMISLV